MKYMIITIILLSSSSTIAQTSLRIDPYGNTSGRAWDDLNHPGYSGDSLV